MSNRLSSIKTLLNKQKLDALLVSSVPNIIYLTGYSGFLGEEREAFLLITKENQYVITDGRYSEAVYNHIPHFQLIEISSTKILKNIFKKLAQEHRIKKLGFEPNNITVSEHKLLSSCYNTLVHVITDQLRIIKSKDEIECIEQACKLGDKAFKYILTKIKKRVSEKELMFELELFIKKQGADISFRPIVAFGKNSSIPHHQSSDQRLKSNDIVLLDFGVKLNDYCSDMTRTVFFGKATKEQKRMYQTVLEAQKRAIEFLSRCHPELARPERGRRVSGSRDSDLRQNDIRANDVDKVARAYIESQSFPSIPHSLGHGVGIEVHESPRFSPNSQPKAGQLLTEKDILKPGMVFSIEPGIYIPGFGGVRIEDLVVLEKSGLPRRKTGSRLLTHSPKDLIQL